MVVGHGSSTSSPCSIRRASMRPKPTSVIASRKRRSEGERSQVDIGRSFIGHLHLFAQVMLPQLASCNVTRQQSSGGPPDRIFEDSENCEENNSGRVGFGLGKFLYMESNCCRLQQTTSPRDGAHTAQARSALSRKHQSWARLKSYPAPEWQAVAGELDSSWTPTGGVGR
jgi:hypothetical protein